METAEEVHVKKRRNHQIVEFALLPDTPTVFPNADYDANGRADDLYKALKGIVAKNKVVMEILTSHSNEQRQEIARAYHRTYGKDLASTIKHELNIIGHYEDALLALLMEPSDYDAHQLHHALSASIKDVDTIIEILCSRDNYELLAIKQSYIILYHQELDKIIQHDIKGDFVQCLRALLFAHRDSSSIPNFTLAEKEATELHEAETGNWAHPESKFIRILSIRSYRQLLATFKQYEKLTGEDVESFIQAHMHGDLKVLMLALVKFVKNKHGFFAEHLHKSMKGLGTNDDKLVRIIVGRCEKDLGNIKDEFLRMYHKTLESFIEGDTSGNYKHLLLALAGAPDPYR